MRCVKCGQDKKRMAFTLKVDNGICVDCYRIGCRGMRFGGGEALADAVACERKCKRVGTCGDCGHEAG